MMIATDAWGWPQWALLSVFLIHLVVASAQHGKPALEESGPDKGQTKKYNAFTAFLRVGVLMFVVISGGFFHG